MHIENPESAPDELKSLISEARSCLETNDTAGALAVLRKGLPTYAKNEKFCFELGYALYEHGDFPEATKYLKTSIKLDPQVRPQKYFTLAQMSDDKPAKDLYTTGLQVSVAKLGQLAAQGLTPQDLAAKEREIKRPMAQAYCALAQLEEKKLETGHQAQFSEPVFLKALSDAAAVFPGYLETYLLGAMYYYNCQNEDLFRQAVAAMVSQVNHLESVEDEELDEYGCEFMLPLVRLLIECQMWAEAARLIEAGLANEVGSLEGNYLLAFSLFSQDKFGQADEVIERLHQLKIEESGDQELIEGYLELKNEVLKKKAADPKAADADDDEDWASDDLEDN